MRRTIRFDRLLVAAIAVAAVFAAAEAVQAAPTVAHGPGDDRRHGEAAAEGGPRTIRPATPSAGFHPE